VVASLTEFQPGQFPVLPALRSEFLGGLRKQSTVISALIYREYRRRIGDARLAPLWLILEPVTHVTILSIIWYIMDRSRLAGVPVPLFLATAVLFFSLARRGINSIPRALSKSDALLDFPQVKPLDLVIAKFCFEIGLLTIGGVLVFGGLIWFFDMYAPFPDPLRLVGMLLLTAILSFGLSLLIGTYARMYPTTQRIADLLSRPLWFISCVMHPLVALPPEARKILAWNPLAQIVEFARHYSLGTKLAPENDAAYTILCSLAIFGLGAMAYYVNRFRLIER
jgi:capsular polysaccharide transport system permease protein